MAHILQVKLDLFGRASEVKSRRDLKGNRWNADSAEELQQSYRYAAGSME